MNVTNIGFLSSHKTNLHVDLKLTKDYLLTHMKQCIFEYCTMNTKTNNHFCNIAVQEARTDFLNEINHLICADNSLQGDIANISNDYKRILIASPSNYLFAKSPGNSVQNKSMQNYTHILSPNPFITDIIKSSYRLDNVQLIDQVRSPLTTYICNEKVHAANQALATQYFPNIQNKKILALFPFGKKPETERKILEQLDLPLLLQSLGKDWFIITNSKIVMEMTNECSSKMLYFIGYLGSLFQTWKVLSFADALITNDSLFFGAFAYRHKPVYCLRYQKNAFECYIHKHYPSLYVANINGIRQLNYDTDLFASQNTEFFKQFCYETSRPAEDVIYQILK